VQNAEVDLLIAVLSVIIGVPVTFCLKDFLVKRSNYKKFKEKLEKIAGVKAEILYPGATLGIGTGARTFRIMEISKQGLVLQDKMNTIFVPIEKVLQTDILLPAEDFETLRRERMKKDAREAIDAVFPPMMDKIKEFLVTELLDDATELSAVVGLRVTSQLKQAGVDTSAIVPTPSLRKIMEELEKREERVLPAKAEQASSTLEQIDTIMEEAPKKITRSKTVKLLQLTQDCYPAMVSASQAALLSIGVKLPPHEDTYVLVKKYLVDTGQLEPEYAQWLKEITEIHGKIESEEISEVQGAVVDEWIEKSEKYVQRMKSLISERKS